MGPTTPHRGLAGSTGSHVGRSCYPPCHNHHYQATPLWPMAADKQAGLPQSHSIPLSCWLCASSSSWKSKKWEATTSLLHLLYQGKLLWQGTWCPGAEFQGQSLNLLVLRAKTELCLPYQGQYWGKKWRNSDPLMLYLNCLHSRMRWAFLDPRAIHWVYIEPPHQWSI